MIQVRKTTFLFKTPGIFRISGVFLFLLCGSIAQGAPAIKVETRVSPSQVVEGQSLGFYITVSGGRIDGSPPRVIQAPDLDIEFRSTVPSRARIGMQHSYSVYTQDAKPGKHVIPPFKISVAGQTVETPPAEFTIRSVDDLNIDPEKDKDVFTRLFVPKKKLYIGEVIPIHVFVFINSALTVRDHGYPVVPRGNAVIKRFQRGTETDVQFETGRYTVDSWESSVTCIKPGIYDLGPVEVQMGYYDLRRTGNRTYISRADKKVVKVVGNSFEVEALPIPNEGSPDDYRGAVGDFELSASAQPTSVGIGEPVMLKFEITGAGNFDSVTVPTLKSTEGWKVHPARRELVFRNNGLGENILQFHQIIVPTQVQKTVPELRLPYFNPKTESFNTLSSVPIPLNFKDVPVAGMGAPGSRGSAPAIPRIINNDILDARFPVSTALPIDRPLPFWKRPGFVILQLIPLLLLSVFGIAKIGNKLKLRRIARSNHPDAPFREALKRIRSGKSATAESLYRDALFCIEASAKKGQSDPEKIAVRDDIEDKLFGSPNADLAKSPDPAELRRIQSALKSLKA